MNHKLSLLMISAVLFSMSAAAVNYTYGDYGSSCIEINESVDKATFDSQNQCDNFLQNCNSLFIAEPSEKCPENVGILGLLIDSFKTIFPIPLFQ